MLDMTGLDDDTRISEHLGISPITGKPSSAIIIALMALLKVICWALIFNCFCE